MPIAFIENQSGTQALATTITATYTTVNSGELLTAHLFTKSDTSPTNPSGWTTDIEVINGTSLDYLRICSKIAGAGEPTAVTFTGMAGDLGVLGIFRFSGAAAAALDKVSSAAFATGVTSKTSGTTAATTQNDEVSVVAYGLRNVAVTSPSLSNSFNLKNSVSDTNVSVATLFDGYFIETVTGTKESTASWTTAADPMGVIATYKALTTLNQMPPVATTRGGRGRTSGPLLRRMMPQTFPVPLPPATETTQSPAAPFMVSRGRAMGPPKRRMFPQAFPAAVVDVTRALTGVASTTGVGTEGVLHTNALAGVSTTTSVGSVKATLARALSGVSTTTGRGTLGVAHAQALAGVASTTARGSVGSARAVSISGVQATGAVGTVTATTGIVVALSGVAATLAVGTMAPSTIAAIAGVQAAGLAGNLTVSGTDVVEAPVSKFRYIIKTKGLLHKSSHREMAELLDRVFATPDEPSVPAPLVEEVRAIVQPFVYKNELHLAKLEKDMRATRKLLDLWTAETARMRAEDEDDDETVMLLS